MQRGFTKLFNTIVTSTIWQEDDKTRIVWITMLAIADADGIVSASIPGLASVSNVSVESAETAIKNLISSDVYSRTREHEGRRIEEVDGGWHILNYVKYRRMLSEEERREYKAKWIQDKRKQMSTMSTDVDERRRLPSASISSSVFKKGDARGKPENQKEVEDFCVSLGLPRSDGTAMWLDWQERGYGKTRDWKAKVQKWKLYGYLPSQKQNSGQFRARPKERAPTYAKALPPRPDLTDDERERNRGLASDMIKDLQGKMKI